MHSVGFGHLNGLSHFSLHGAFFSTGLQSNLSFSPPPPLFGFCFATAVIIVFWSAVIAGGKIGPDGVLLCMNGELEELGLNRPSLNGVYAPPACLGCGTHITVA